MADHTDIMVSVRQGSYYLPDVKQYMTDEEYAVWYVNHSGGRIEVKKARKEHTCNICELPILKGTEYYAIFYGGGLGGLKFPDKVHKIRDCIKEYADKRKAQQEGHNV